MNVPRSTSRLLQLQLALEYLIVFLLFQGDLVSAEKELDLESKKSYRFITSHIHSLHQCNKYLTFLASIAVGAFATKVLHESPLTPLPLPPIDDPPRWNLLTLPAHMSSPFFHWMRKYSAKPFYRNQRYDDIATPWYPEMTMVHSMADNHLLRFRRHLSQEAISRTIKPLKFLPHLLGLRKLLSRFCP